METQFKRLKVKTVNVFILLMSILFLINIQSRRSFRSVFWVEILIILLPSLGLVLLNKRKVRFSLGIRHINMKQCILTVLAMAFAYVMIVILNAILISFLSKFIEIRDSRLPLPKDFGEYLMGLIVLAAVPGICEEVMFRGVVLNAYSKYGKILAISITSLLFAMFHFSVQNFITPFIVGIILGEIAYRTKSIIPCMIGHATSNAIGVTINYFSKNVSSVQNSELGEMAEYLMTNKSLILVLGILFLISLFFTFIVVKAIPGPMKDAGEMFDINGGGKTYTSVNFLSMPIEYERSKSSYISYIAMSLFVLLYLYYNLKIYGFL